MKFRRVESPEGWDKKGKISYACSRAKTEEFLGLQDRKSRSGIVSLNVIAFYLYLGLNINQETATFLDEQPSTVLRGSLEITSNRGIS